jgi:hypothetical protein
MEMQMREVNCLKANTHGQFANGTQDYSFSVQGASKWIPHKSYFKTIVRVTAPGGADPLGLKSELTNEVALADNVIGNLFDNIYLKGGGQDISTLTSFAPQASIVRQRITKSGAWLSSQGKDVYGLDASYTSRVNKISLDTSLEEEVDRINPGDSLNKLTYTIAFDNAGNITGVGTNFDGTSNPDVPVTGDSPAVPLLRAGDYFQVHTPVGIVKIVVANVASATAATYVVPNLTVGINATTSCPCFRGKDKQNVYAILWKPPIGIFDSDVNLGSGDYRITLNPNANYKTSAIESLSKLVASETGAAVGTFNFEVLELKLYIALVKDEVKQSGVESLFLLEQHLQSKPITGYESSLDFNVPPSTKMLAFFIQSNKAGSDTRIPPSRFKALNNYDMAVKSFQLTYANRSRPSTRWTSEYTTTKNTMQQRFYDTFQECGLANLQGGTESLADWIERGPMYVYKFDRDSTDKSTQVQLQLLVDRYEPGCNVIMCAFFTRTVEIAYQNGLITNVVSLNV